MQLTVDLLIIFLHEQYAAFTKKLNAMMEVIQQAEKTPFPFLTFYVIVIYDRVPSGIINVNDVT